MRKGFHEGFQLEKLKPGYKGRIGFFTMSSKAAYNE
jgi:hypothetical protein